MNSMGRGHLAYINGSNSFNFNVVDCFDFDWFFQLVLDSIGDDSIDVVV